jgi:hypothetical protein
MLLLLGGKAIEFRGRCSQKVEEFDKQYRRILKKAILLRFLFDRQTHVDYQKNIENRFCVHW